jgi:energy-coupling factor transporter ATP-binding protein EcfA2
MIKQFRVQNYKALRDVRLDLTPLHALIGPNDSGKTSVLEALAALCRTVDFGLNEAFWGAWTGRALVWHADPSLPVVLGASVSEGKDSFDYEVSCRFAASERRSEVETEKLVIDGTTVTLPAPRSPQTIVKLVQERGTTGYDEFRAVALKVHGALSGVHHYRWNPKLMGLPAAPDSQRRFRMDESGFGLVLLLDDILGYDRKRFNQLEDRFKQVFPQVEAIRLVAEKAYRAPIDSARPVPLLQQAEGKGLYFDFGSGGIVAASQVSDGLILVLAYLTLLHLPEPPRLLLIEEPENGIHPKRIEQVLTILKSLVKEQTRSQVLITTHSPYVLDLFEPREVSLCRKDADSAVSIHRLSDSKTIRDQLDIFSLGEIWAAEGEEKIIRASQPPAGAVP